MTRPTVAGAVLVAFVAVAAACGADDEPGGLRAPATEAASTPTTAPAIPPVTVPATAPATAPTAPDTAPAALITEVSAMTSIPAADAGEDPVARAAVADLARRLEVPVSEISVASLERGVWNDGSIGCPRPGMSYTEALVPGVRVALVHAGATYWYHQGGAGEVFWCPDPAAGAFRGGAGDELVPPPRYTD